MPMGNVWNELSPQVRVVTAALPFTIAIFVRLVMGSNQLSRWLLSLSVLWFSVNILMAPYAAGMRQDIRSLRTLLR
jgi:hypothetical protein